MAHVPVTLLDGVTADTDGDSIKIIPPDKYWLDPEFAVYVRSANFGGGKVWIMVSLDDTNWFPARTRNNVRAIFSGSDHIVVWIRARYIMARLIGSTSPSAVYAQILSRET